MTTNAAEHLAELGSPLQALLRFLQQQIPIGVGAGLITRFDSVHKLEGSLEQSVYQSMIFHLARRMIVLAKYSVENSPAGFPAEVVKNAISSTFDLGSFTEPDRLFQLVYECYATSKKQLSDGKKNSVLRDSKKNGACCYLCGIELTYTDEEDPTYCEVEHVLPRSLGGGNEYTNLKPACKSCNGMKRDRLGGADIHFELMVYPFTERGRHKINDYHVFSALFHGKNACELCGRDAEDAGYLDIGQKESDDSWHVFNTLLICSDCSAPST